jgi:hypothetical protein
MKTPLLLLLLSLALLIADESHNSGQNCLNCHYDGGPANEHVFNMAGTIYTDPEGTEIQPNVNVYIEDANANLYLLVSSWIHGNIWFEEDEYEVECNDVPMELCIELDQCEWEYDDEECEDAEGVPVQTPVPPFTATVEYNGYTATMPQSVQSGSCNSCHVAGMRIYVPMNESEEISISYNSEWNLVGLPLEVEDASYNILFPESTEGTLYSFDETYILGSTLNQSEGYWLRFDNSGTTTITGTPIDELTISLSEGWNLVSGLHFDLSIYSINDSDSTIVPSTLFGFSDAYFLTEELVPGKGYWLRAFQDGEVTITGDGLARVTPQDFSLNGKANTLTVNGIDLYFGIEMSARERLSYSLPPKPPAGAFDVRFKDGWRAVKDYGEVEVMPTTETLTIAYDIKLNAGEHYNWVLNSETLDDYVLENAGEITVPSAERFTLELKAVVPATFTLHQNFPNPFNPITTLRYDLPSDALVTLSIYDMLGREITQLVNTTQQAGFRSVQWDATDSMGRPVSAGVYLYQIQAGEFVQTKKMVLLK